MKVILEYDTDTGNLKDRDGVILTTWLGIAHFGEATDSEKPATPAELVTLKEAGFTAEEIIALKKKGIF